ncbi:MAG: GyrI-like domain-containing protein [Candidatus Hodarchaeales archaeon]|jgi:predicted transcriptional regulator YdeE
MNHSTVKLDSFIVQAMKKRTTNENNLASKDIRTLWEKFYKENKTEKISYKKSDELIALYTEYEKDHTEPYTYYLGHRVKKTGLKSKDLYFIVVPKGRYAVIDVFEPFPDSIFNAWREIWDSDLKRAYTVDFEVYGKDYFREKEKKMKIYLSLKME